MAFTLDWVSCLLQRGVGLLCCICCVLSSCRDHWVPHQFFSFLRLNSSNSYSSLAGPQVPPCVSGWFLSWTLLCSCLSCTEKLNTRPRTPDVSPEQTGKIISLNLLMMLFLMYSIKLLAFFSKKAHFWLMVKFSSTGILAHFLPSCLLAPSMYWCLELFFPRCRTCHLPLLNFTTFLRKHSSNLLRSLGMAVLPLSMFCCPKFCHLQTCWNFVLSYQF